MKSEKWTVFYTESWMAGSHMQTLACVKHVEGKDFKSALNSEDIEPTQVVAAYDGHLVQSKNLD